MNRTYAAAAVVVIVLAIGVIAISGALSPAAPSGSQSSSAASSSSGVALTSSTGASSSSSSISSSGAGASGGSQGSFSMLATDPPITASGVSKVFLQYSGEDVHSTGSASANGWVGLNSSGTIEVTSLVNTTQAIASAKIKSGTYDMARLDVTSVKVLYNNQNYTASVPSGNLTANMSSHAQVNASSPSAAVIDLRTVVVNAGNSSNPQFLFSASAGAVVVPSSDVSASLTVGAKVDFHTQPWWSQLVIRSTATLHVSSANMTSNSLSLKVTDTGGSNTTLRLVTITPVSASAGGTLPSTLAASATFLVDQNGSLSSSTQASLQTLLLGPGLNVGAGSSTTLTYSGAIQLGKGGLLNVTGVLKGQEYLVTVISSDTAASIMVVAG